MSGTIAILNGETLIVSGQIDGYGNLVAEAMLKGQKAFVVEAKLADQDFRRTTVYKKAELGTQIFLTNLDGIVTIFVIPVNAIMP